MFEVGDELICIDNHDYATALTANTVVYTVVETVQAFGSVSQIVRIVNNNGVNYGYYSHRFELAKPNPPFCVGSLCS
jgi:hypothetical protein